MITCPNCNHQNPQEALQCENCYSSLPGSISCPNCGASVQADATFCGQCGFNLNTLNLVPETEVERTVTSSPTNLKPEEPVVTSMSTPMASPWDEDDATADNYAEDSETTAFMETSAYDAVNSEADEPEPTIVTTPVNENWESNRDAAFTSSASDLDDELASEELSDPDDEDFDLSESFAPVELESEPISEESIITFADESEATIANLDSARAGFEIEDLDNAPASAVDDSLDRSKAAAPSASGSEVSNKLPDEIDFTVPQASEKLSSSVASSHNQGSGAISDSATQLQSQNISLLHVQSNTALEVPTNLNLIHIGKPNSKIPPDIDVSGFANSEIVSRIHADLRLEGDIYFLEDVGSSNGTYVNHTSLIPGNRHRLRAGDRISLGKEDLVTFIFQIDYS